MGVGENYGNKGNRGCKVIWGIRVIWSINRILFETLKYQVINHLNYRLFLRFLIEIQFGITRKANGKNHK